MKVWIVGTDKAQFQINILSPIICYIFMSSFISDTYQLALLYFSGILEEDITENLSARDFPVGEENHTWSTKFAILYEVRKSKTLYLKNSGVLWNIWSWSDMCGSSLCGSLYVGGFFDEENKK